MAALKNDGLAKALLQNGNRFGRQHVVFQSNQAYPAYVVRYRMLPATAAVHAVRVMSSTSRISVAVGNRCVYQDTPGHSFVVVVVNITTRQNEQATLFNIHEATRADAMIDVMSRLSEDEIVVVACGKRSIPRKWSAKVATVLQSLRSVGGSMHALNSPYVLVGAKQPHLLNGLVHEDHQRGKAAVSVDVRVIRHNRDSVAPTPQRHDAEQATDDMIPVYWQQQCNTKHGVVWKDVCLRSSELTAAYQSKTLQTKIDGQTVDLVNMKVRGVNIRCLNWKGETLPPLHRSTTPKYSPTSTCTIRI